MSHSLWPPGQYSPWNSPRKNTGVGSHSLLQGIFPTEGLIPGLLHCRQILYQLSHQGSPSCTAWRFLTDWTIRGCVTCVTEIHYRALSQYICVAVLCPNLYSFYGTCSFDVIGVEGCLYPLDTETSIIPSGFQLPICMHHSVTLLVPLVHFPLQVQLFSV